MRHFGAGRATQVGVDSSWLPIISLSFHRLMILRPVQGVSVDCVVFPLYITETEHFVLFAADMGTKNLSVFDSYSGTTESNFDAELQMIVAALDSRITNSDDSDGFRPHFARSPQQSNKFDCGVFLLMNAYKIMLDDSFCFEQEDILDLRHQLRAAVLAAESGRVIEPFVTAKNNISAN